MENQLKPNVHYVEVSNDWGDLDEKVEWCNNNQDSCLEIINNAQAYMERFKDIRKEKKIERRVLRRYFEILYPAQE